MSFCDPRIEGIPRSAIIIVSPLGCNSVFPKHTRLISFLWAPIRIVLPVEEYYLKKLVVLCLESKSHSQKFLKKAITTYKSHCSKWIFSATPVFGSSIKISIQNLSSADCRRGVDWKTIDNDPCIIILIVQNYLEVVTKNDCSRLSKR